MLIIVNDNDMSIAENHGGLYQNLKALRESQGQCPQNLFEAMNLDYHYIDQRNDIESLIKAFEDIKDIDHPIVLHIKTIKGKGYEIAERNKESWHWSVPFDVTNGKPLHLTPQQSIASITCDFLMDKIKKDPAVVVLTAGVPVNIGFTKEKRDACGQQFVDVGIAKNGGKPIFATHSSFIQRIFDQLSQDLCINHNPATILVNTASVYGMNDITHLGIFDIPLISHIPEMVYLAPINKIEYLAMLD